MRISSHYELCTDQSTTTEWGLVKRQAEHSRTHQSHADPHDMFPTRRTHTMKHSSVGPCQLKKSAVILVIFIIVIMIIYYSNSPRQFTKRDLFASFFGSHPPSSGICPCKLTKSAINIVVHYV